MRLGRNVLWNLFGTGLPLVAAIVTIPILLKGMGAERFGVLALAWVVVGYFSIFDMGLGRALTKLIAEWLARDKLAQIPRLVWTALCMMALLGLAGGALLFGLSNWLVESVLSIPAPLISETKAAFLYLALSIPFVVITSGARGVLEGYQKFALINLLRLPMGLATFLIPVAILPTTSSLAVIVAGLVLARLVFAVAHFIAFLALVPGLRVAPSFSAETARPLLSFGGWMTVSNLVSPLLVYVDRFFIGSIVTISAVANYATPYEMITRLLVVPRAIMGVLFPALSGALAREDGQSIAIFRRWSLVILNAVFPIVLFFFAFADRILSLWLGEAMATESVPVLRWLALGVFINAAAHMTFGVVQAAGRPDFTAKLHLAELPFYIGLLWLLTSRFGITGAAAAWVLRVSADAIVLLLKSFQILRFSNSQSLRFGSFLAVWTLAILPAVAISSENMRLLYVFALLVIIPVASWFQLSTGDQRRAQNWLRARAK